jgi:hypothetical protein
VCFFLVLTPWDALKTAVNPPITHAVKDMPSEIDLVGTNLAPSPQHTSADKSSHGTLITREEFSPRDRTVALTAEIPLFEKDLKLLSISGIENLRASIGREVSPDIAKSTSVLIRLCDGEVDFDQVVPVVGRMLLEVGVTESQLVISLPASSCDRDVTMRPVSDTVVGSVTFLTDRKVAGKGRK